MHRFSIARLMLARLAITAFVAIALFGSLLTGGQQSAAAPDPGCRTSFIVFTDPNNIGAMTVNGPIQRFSDSGVLGSYTSGRFAGYAISGLQELALNTDNLKASIHGSFVATSPDGGSSFTVTYSGRADLNAATATGQFRVSDGTGELAGFRAHGKIEATFLGNLTFEGVDIGLC